MKRWIALLLPVLIPLVGLGLMVYLPARGQQPARAAAGPRAALAPQVGIVVDTMADELNGDGDCSLREAVAAASANAAVDACPAGELLTDTITFSMAGRITVSQPISVAGGGPLLIDGAELVTTSGGNATRVWFVAQGSTLTLQGLAVVDGYTFADGAGLYNNGSLTLIHSTFSANTTHYIGSGGGLYNNGQAAILDSTFSGNSATEGSAGGGISNHGSLAILNSQFSGNRAASRGGGIDNAGALSIIHSTFTQNVSVLNCWYQYSCVDNPESYGGGIHNAGSLTIRDSTFTDNRSDFSCDPDYCLYQGISHGGGIGNSGLLTITGSTFSGNRANLFAGAYGSYAAFGGGIDNSGALSITNSTIANNSAPMLVYCDSHVGCWGSYYSYGGGITNGGALRMASSTLSGNSAYGGMDGSYGGGIDSWGSARLANTIVADNDSGGDCSGPITDGGHNLASDGSCGFNPLRGSLPQASPRLGVLQDNGGPTWTQSLLPSSPALDAGDDNQCPFSDQRGFYRPIDGDGDGLRACDIGSYEAGSVDPWGIHLIPPSPYRGGLPGATITYTLQLFNHTAITDSYSLELGAHAWTAALSTDAIGPLPPDGWQAFSLAVSIPPEAAWGQLDTLVLTATSLTRPAEYLAVARITARTYLRFYLPVLLK